MQTKNDMGAKTAGTIANHPAGFVQTAPNETFNWYGLTKREYMATACLQGIILEGIPGSFDLAAADAVKYANALIKALNNDV